MLITKTDDRSVVAHIIIGFIMVSLAAFGSFSISHSGQPSSHSMVQAQ
jgi:hypothetical protein